MDTCHVWDAGYDIANHLDDVLAEFDHIIGLNRLKAIHLNDSIESPWFSQRPPCPGWAKARLAFRP